MIAIIVASGPLVASLENDDVTGRREMSLAA